MGSKSAQTRMAHTDQKIFDTAIALLREEGIRAVTIEAVSARSGVGKTTIYRRYADRYELLRATVEHFVPVEIGVPDIDIEDPRRGLIAALDSIGHMVERHVGYSVASAIIAEPDDQAADEIRKRVIRPRMHQLMYWLNEWKADGLLREDLDVDMALATLLGSAGATFAFYQTFPEGWAERVVAFLWPVLGPTASGTPAVSGTGGTDCAGA